MRKFLTSALAVLTFGGAVAAAAAPAEAQSYRHGNYSGGYYRPFGQPIYDLDRPRVRTRNRRSCRRG